MRLSKRAKYMMDNPSSIREIMNLVARYERHPEEFQRELIYLAGGWPQDTPPRFFKEVFQNVVDDVRNWKKAARYSPTNGYPGVREGVAKYEEKIWGRQISPDNVIFGLGSTEQIGAVLISLLEPGEEVILTSPGYLNYERQIQVECGTKTKLRSWKILKGNSFSPSIEDLKETVTDRTKLLIITSPGNPDGQIWDDADLQAINELAEDEDFYTLIDTAYRAYHYKKEAQYLRRPPLSREIWSCSMSKELRAPGWRVSYLILPEDLMRPIETIEQGRTLAPSSPLQRVLTEVFHSKELLTELKHFYKRGRKKYQRVCYKTVEKLREIPDLPLLEPEGGFYVFFNVDAYGNDKEIWQELIDEKQVALAPGSDFNGANGWIRLSFAPVVEDQQKLWEGIERMKDYFKAK